MQTFKDSVTSKVWAFEDDVKVTETSGVYSFITAAGVALSSTPTTLQPYVIPAPTSVELLVSAQTKKLPELFTAYLTAIYASISFFTAAGTGQIFQADRPALGNLHDMLAAYAPTGALPSGFYWVALDNTQVPFTLADLQGLAGAIGTRGWTEFQQCRVSRLEIGRASCRERV